MKTLTDIHSLCIEIAEQSRSLLIDKLDELDRFDLGSYKGAISCADEIAELIYKALKYHDCEDGKDGSCVICGEKPA